MASTLLSTLLSPTAALAARQQAEQPAASNNPLGLLEQETLKGLGMLRGSLAGLTGTDLRSPQERVAEQARQIVNNPSLNEEQKIQAMKQIDPALGMAYEQQVLTAKSTRSDIELNELKMQAAQRPDTLSPKERADLYRYFDADSIDGYLESGTPLVPLDDNKTEALSAYGKQLVDAGYQPGSAQYEAQMREFNQKELASKGQIKTVNVMSPFEQTDFLKSQIESDPLFKAATSREDKINIAQAAMPQARGGSAEGITTLQRTLSDLFNSDTRAASEIERFVSGNKSLLRAFNDLVSRKIYGELSTAELENYNAILDAVIKSTNQQKQDVVDKNLSLFADDLDNKAVQSVRSVYGKPVGTVDNDPLGIR